MYTGITKKKEEEEKYRRHPAIKRLSSDIMKLWRTWSKGLWKMRIRWPRQSMHVRLNWNKLDDFTKATSGSLLLNEIRSRLTSSQTRSNWKTEYIETCGIKWGICHSVIFLDVYYVVILIKNDKWFIIRLKQFNYYSFFLFFFLGTTFIASGIIYVHQSG